VEALGEVRVRAARGAIHVDEDSSDSVLSATERLLAQMLERNDFISQWWPGSPQDRPPTASNAV